MVVCGLSCDKKHLDHLRNWIAAMIVSTRTNPPKNPMTNWRSRFSDLSRWDFSSSVPARVISLGQSFCRSPLNTSPVAKSLRGHTFRTFAVGGGRGFQKVGKGCVNSIGLIYSKSGQWGKGVQKSKIVCGRHTSTIPDGDAPLKTPLLGLLLGVAES